MKYRPVKEWGRGVTFGKRGLREERERDGCHDPFLSTSPSARFTVISRHFACTRTRASSMHTHISRQSQHAVHTIGFPSNAELYPTRVCAQNESRKAATRQGPDPGSEPPPQPGSATRDICNHGHFQADRCTQTRTESARKHGSVLPTSRPTPPNPTHSLQQRSHHTALQTPPKRNVRGNWISRDASSRAAPLPA